jgi:type 1 glutamine amidotransferase
MRKPLLWPIALSAASLLVSSCSNSLGAPPKNDDIQRITSAVPSQPLVRVNSKRKLLVFNRANGFRHSSIEIGSKAMEILGQKTGAWETVINDDPAVFTAENLKQYDAICFLSTTGDVFTPPLGKDATEEQKQEARKQGEAGQQALLNFVSGGKGFIGIHAATDTAYNWPGYGELIGGYFDGHPWGSGDQVSVRVEDKTHPITRHLNGENMDFKEEIYQFKEPYSRKQQRVLQGLDLGKTAPKSGMKRKDNDYPVTWVKSYGTGRVFYCSLGHREDKFWDPKVLGVYLGGIQFAMGDLKADAAPLPQPPVPVYQPTIEKANDPVDPVLGEYLLGEYQTAARNGGLARLYPEGDNNYRAVVYPSQPAGIIQRIELTGKLENNAIAFKDNDGIWEGRWTPEGFSATPIGAAPLNFKKIVRTSPTLGQRPPRDAVVLLPFVPGQSTNLNEWNNQSWVLMNDGSVRVQGGDNRTNREFGDIHLHIEWMTPLMPGARGQGRGNSGVYLQDRYEVQILDSFGLDLKDNDAGGIYQVSVPKTNASLPPGSWQTYDITFRAPRLNADGSMDKPAVVTVLLNGVAIQENVELKSETGGGAKGVKARAPIRLQDHGNPVRFRNIWLQELKDRP